MPRRPIVVAALITTALAAVACSAGDAGQNTQTPQLASSSASEPDSYAFGETFDGPIRTTVAEPETFTTSATAQPQQNADAWKVDVTYENTTDQPFNGVALTVDGYTNNTKGTDVFDSDAGVGNTIDTATFLPGTSATVTYGFTGPPDGNRKVVVSSIDGSTSAIHRRNPVSTATDPAQAGTAHWAGSSHLPPTTHSRIGQHCRCCSVYLE